MNEDVSLTDLSLVFPNQDVRNLVLLKLENKTLFAIEAFMQPCPDEVFWRRRFVENYGTDLDDTIQRDRKYCEECHEFSKLRLNKLLRAS
jgi:hypothetical protein